MATLHEIVNQMNEWIVASEENKEEQHERKAQLQTELAEINASIEREDRAIAALTQARNELRAASLGEAQVSPPAVVVPVVEAVADPAPATPAEDPMADVGGGNLPSV